MTEATATVADAPRDNIIVIFLAGAAAALVGAAVWATVAVVTGYELGLLAIGVGLIVGLAIRAVRKHPKDPSAMLGVIGAVLALAGCVLGNAASLVALAAQQANMPLGEVVLRVTPGMMVELMQAGFAPMDLLFYAIAIYEGYKFASK